METTDPALRDVLAVIFFKSMRKIFKYALFYLCLVIGLFLILIGVNWYLVKQKEVRLGLSRSNFPYTKYNQEELNKMYPQILNENVPTHQTPEETYKLLRNYLKTGEIDLAKELFTSAYKEKFYQELKKSKEVGILTEILGRLPEKIIKNERGSYGNFMQYDFEDSGSVIFTKDLNGDWKIDSL